MEGGVSEHELTYKLTVGAALNLAKVLDLEFKYFIDKVLITAPQFKHIKRIDESNVCSLYTKKTHVNQNYLHGLLVYKSSTETPETVEMPYKNFAVKKAAPLPSIAGFPGKLELIIGRNITNPKDGFDDKNIKAQLDFNNPALYQTPSTLFAFISFEFETQPNIQTMNKFLQKLFAIYPNDYASLYFTMKRPSKNHYYMETIKECDKNTVKQADIEDIRRVILPAKAELGMLWYGEKIDGCHGYLFVWDSLLLYISPEWVRIQYQDIVTSTLYELYHLPWKEIFPILKEQYIYGFEGEYLNDVFYIFATFSRDSGFHKGTWGQVINNTEIIDEVAPLCEFFTLKSKQYAPFNETLTPLPIEKDGLIYVCGKSIEKYVQMTHYKVKNIHANTIDCLVLNDMPNVIVPYSKVHLLVKDPFVRDSNYDQPAFFELIDGDKYNGYVMECAIKSSYQLEAVKKRKDKITANGINVWCAVITGYRCGDLNEYIKSNQTTGFSGKPSQNKFRYSVSATTRKILDEFLTDVDHSQVLDLGGGKLGYLSTLGKFEFQVYSNIDTSLEDLLGGFSRVCNSIKRYGIKLYNVYEMYHGSMSSTRTLSVFKSQEKTNYTVIMSIFALHFGFESEESLDNLVDILSELSAPQANFLFIEYDTHKIKAQLDTNGVLDLDLVKFQYNAAMDKFLVTPTFGETAFEEPFCPMDVLTTKLEKKGIICSSKKNMLDVYKMETPNEALETLLSYIDAYFYTKG